MFAFFSLTPLLFCGNLVFIALGFALAIKTAKRNKRLTFINISLVLIPSIIYWFLHMQYTGVEREMAFEMEWSNAGKTSMKHPEDDEIVLRFKSYPSHLVGIYSKDLGKYLEKLPSHDVRVIFSVITDFGKTRGFQQIQIGELRSWNSEGGYAGFSGTSSEPSPWP